MDVGGVVDVVTSLEAASCRSSPSSMDASARPTTIVSFLAGFNGICMGMLVCGGSFFFFLCFLILTWFVSLGLLPIVVISLSA